MSKKLGEVLRKKVEKLKSQDIIQEMEEGRIYSVLFNPNRSGIFERITFMPGITISTLAYAMHMAPTSVKWHIQIFTLSEGKL